jgi:hypothetical protein
MLRRMFFIFGFMLFGEAPFGQAMAMEVPAPSSVMPARESPAQRLTFGDEMIETTRDIGGGEIINGRRPIKHSTLIKIRQDFLPELIKSAEQL